MANFTVNTFEIYDYNSALGVIYIRGNNTTSSAVFVPDMFATMRAEKTNPPTGGDASSTSFKNDGVDGTQFYTDIDVNAIGSVNPGDEFTLTYFETGGAGVPNVQELNIAISCFVRGTLIRTPTGDVPVEELKAGDSVVSTGTLKDRRELVPYSSPVSKPIVKILNSTIRNNLTSITRPVKIVAGAFGKNLPTQDLFVSPWHGFIENGFLKSAQNMLNGSTINYDHSCESVEYYHLELEEHSVIIANGVEAETLYADKNPPPA
jgi:hypothetical protein